MKKYYSNRKYIFILFLIVLVSIYYISKMLVAETSLTKKEKDWLVENGPIIYTADRNAPPLRFVDDADEQYKGILIDYLNALSVEIGTNIEFYPRVWEEVLLTLSYGDADISDMFASPERGRYFEFSDPIYNLRAVLAVSDKNEDTENLSDIIGEKIGVQKSDYASEYLSTNYPGITQVFTDDVEEALLLLKDGKVDAVIGDEPVVFYNLNELALNDGIRVVENPVYENQVVFAVNKDKSELVPILNKGIKTLNQKSVLEKIQQKWFGISAPIVTQENIEGLKRAAFATSIAAILILLGMWVWNNSLKRLINLRTKELEYSRDELQKVFDGMKEFLVVLDKESKILSINASFLNHLGIEKETLLGSEIDEKIKIAKDLQIKDQALETLTENKSLNRETAYINQVYSIKTYPLGDTNENSTKALVLIHDVTSEKISENKLLQANKMVAIGELAAGVAHEIRNPLGIIRNHSFIIKNQTDPGMIKKSLEYIDSAVKRASRIIDNLLNFSRMSGETVENVDIKDFILNIIDLQGKTLDKLGIKPIINCPEDLTIGINVESLKHIFINLVSNAADSMKNGGDLTIDVDAGTDSIVFRVADTGHGIKDEELTRIFNPFYTTKEPGVGTGLGLYIVYNEVEKQGGSIEVENKYGSGTAFIVKLPLGDIRND